MRNSFIYNPYNLLGLSSECTQAEIRKRVGFIEKMTAIDEPVVFDCDLFVDAKDRSISVVKECEGRLCNPTAKVADTFFWFGVRPEAYVAALTTNRQYFNVLYAKALESQQEPDFDALKDAAVGMSIIFEQSQEKADFENALRKWARLVKSDSFWDHWTDYYRSIDYLDTSDRVINEFRAGVESTIVDRFFDVSKLDDLIDAQIVSKFFTISSDAVEKAAEQQLMRIKELRVEVETLMNSGALLTNGYALSAKVKNGFTGILNRAASLHLDMAKNSQLEAPAIKQEFDNLWEDILGSTISLHNESGMHDAVNADDLAFQKRIITRLIGMASNPLLKDRLVKNNTIIDEEVSSLEKLALIEPEYSQLMKLMERLGDLSIKDKAGIENELNSFLSLYTQIQDNNKLRHEPLSDVVSALVGVFNMIATSIGNDAQAPVNSAMRSIEAAQRFSQNSSFSPQSSRLRMIEDLDESIKKARADIKFAQSILNKIKTLQIDSTLKATINRNIEGISDTLNTLDDLSKQVLLARALSNASHASSSSGSNTNSGGCYVATAVYGSYDCPEVWTLRRFRDYDLAQTCLGRLFIRVYYATSPTIVRLFGDSHCFKRLCRSSLDKLVNSCRARGYTGMPYEDLNWK